MVFIDKKIFKQIHKTLIMKSVLISTIDQLIIKIWNDITNNNLSNSICSDFKTLLNTLKIEAKSIGCNEVSNNLTAVSQTINQTELSQRQPIYAICCETLAILVEQYIKIIDAK